MKSPVSRPRLNAQIYEEACDWLVHFRAGDADHDAEARRRLDEWLRRSPEHVRAYLEVSTLWEDVAGHDSERVMDAEAHIARALSDTNVISLGAGDTTSKGSASTAGRRLRRVRLRTLAAAASVIALLVCGYLGWTQLRRPVYATTTGEQRSLTLDDGSSIELNAHSRIRVDFTQQQRSIHLLEGQALFRVAGNAARPFVVLAGDTRVRAIGTQFDVNRRRSATTVTVIEGRVGVASPAVLSSPVEPHPPLRQRAAKVQEVVLGAGEQLTVSPVATARPRQANVAAVTAWTQHRLVFDSVPLSEVAEEFNRYNRRRIVIRDEALEGFGVVGVFSSTNPASLLMFLRAQPEIAVIERDDEIQITRK